MQHGIAFGCGLELLSESVETARQGGHQCRIIRKFERTTSISLGLVFPTTMSKIPPKERPNTKKNAATGASAASVRAIASQMIAFYFRAPVKAFFRARVE